MIDQRPARDPRGLRPDADRGRAGLGRRSTPGSRPSRKRWTATATTLPRRPRRATSSPRGSTPRSPSQVRGWTGQSGGGGDFFADLVAGCDVDGALRRAAGPARRRGHAGAFAEFGLFLEHEMVPRGARQRGGRAANTTRSHRAYFLGAEVDLDETYAVGLGGAQADLRRDGRDGRPRSGPGATVDEAVARLDADPSRTIHGRRGVPRLDAGAGRPHPRRARRRPLRHPRAGPPHRVHARADQRRRHLLHRPVRGLHPARAGCGGRCPTASTTSRPGGRSRRSTTRACPAITSRSRRRRTAATLLNRWQRLLCWVQRPRRGLGAVRRAADGRARLPRPIPADRLGHARRPELPRRPGDRRHRHAPGARDPARQPVRLPPGRDAGRPTLGLRVHARALPDGGRVHAVRGQPLPRLAGPGAVVQGRRADLARRPRRRRRHRPGGRTSTSRRSTAQALDLGSLGLDPLTTALARL